MSSGRGETGTSLHAILIWINCKPPRPLQACKACGLSAQDAIVTVRGSVDFYIESFTQAVSAERVWFIYKGSLACCVGVFGDCIDATAHAIPMAEYQVACGNVAQIHVRDRTAGPWRTVWCPPGVDPRFPQFN